MGKKVTIGKRPSARASAEAVDKWMEAEKPAEPAGEGSSEKKAPVKKALAKKVKVKVEPEKMKRLTIDIPDTLHRRVKSGCGSEGIKMADVIREYLEGRFPV